MLSQSLESIIGNLITIFEIRVSENPYFFNNAISESAISGVFGPTYLESDKACFGESPDELMR